MRRETVPRRQRKIVLRLLAVVLLAPALFVGVRWWGGNLGTIEEKSLYRAAQLTPRGLKQVIDRWHIKTVLNLRGCNPDKPWYQREREAALATGSTLVDVSMASDQWMSRVQLRAVVELLETAQKPMLIHCEWGAERTGLVSAFAELLRESGTLDRARAQFSPAHLYLPTADGRVMSAHVEQYAGWLASQGWQHSPAKFRDWSRSAYQPRTPTREDWPYDPYPLVVVTRPPQSELAQNSDSEAAPDTAR